MSLRAPAAAATFGDAHASRSVSELSWLLLAYVLAMAMFADLAPFALRLPERVELSYYIELQDGLLNVFLLLPAGFLFRLAQRGRGMPSCIDALLYGLLLSTLLEAVQLFIPGRTSSPVDAINNALGAWAGAKLHSQLGPWLDRKLSQQLSLDLSLSNVLYLSLPLITLEALTGREQLQPLLIAPLIGMSSLVSAALYHHRLQRASGLSPARFSWAVAAYFGIGLMPALKSWPVAWALELVGVVCCVRLALALLARERAADRRFQSTTVTRALPFLIAYILLHGAYPLHDFGSRMPALGPAIEHYEHKLPQSVVLGMLAVVAAVTLLGYLLAERRARSDASTLAIIGICTLQGFVVCTVYVLLRGTHAQLHASPAMLCALTLACGAGAAIQRAQLRVVMTLLVGDLPGRR